MKKITKNTMKTMKCENCNGIGKMPYEGTDIFGSCPTCHGTGNKDTKSPVSILSKCECCGKGNLEDGRHCFHCPLSNEMPPTLLDDDIADWEHEHLVK